MTHYFANIEGAETYRTEAAQSITNLSVDDGYYEVGVKAPVSVSSVTTVQNPNYTDPGTVDETSQYYFGQVTQPREE